MIVVCAVPLALAITTLYQSNKRAALLQIGRLIADNEPVSAQGVASERGDIQSLVADGRCREDLLAAGLRTTLKDLDFQNSYTDYEAWSQQMISADRFLTHALSCRPTDGDLWARLAMVRWSVVEISEEQALLMRMSHQYAPAEQSIIRARLVQWSRLSEASLKALESELSSDIQVMLLQFPTKEVATTINSGSAQFKTAVSKAALIIPQTRQDQITKAGARLDALL